LRSRTIPKFVPDNFTPRPKDIQWAIKEFDIDSKEVTRQFELMRDYEFKRNYTDYNRVFRNWMRKADELQLLRREHKYKTQHELTEEERQQDIEKFKEQMKRFKVVK
jgi:hypothetical protein